MAALLDMDKFTFVGKVIQSVSELIMEETIQGPDFNLIHTVYPGIVAHEEVGFIGEGGLLGVKGQGCDPTPQPWNIGTRLLEWDPTRWEFLLTACWTDLESTAAIYSLHTGVRIPDFTDTDYMNIVLEVLRQSLAKFWYRLYWFNDKDAQNVSAGGNITDGLDLQYFNIIDGFWKRIMVQIGAVPAQHTAVITENSGATYADQALDPANIQGYFSKVVYGANKILRRQTDRFILVTQTVYDAYEQFLSDACCLESSRQTLLNGTTALTFNGIPIVPMQIWDEMIDQYENTGTKWINPHRILFTSKSVLGVGIDNVNSFDQFNVWYDRDTRKVKIEGMGRSDAQLTNPAYFSLGI